MVVEEQEFRSKASKLRSLSDSEKVTLICGQQFSLEQLQTRVDDLKCAHEQGLCVLCADKDKTIQDMQEQIKLLKTKVYGRSSEKRRSGGKPKKKSPDSKDNKKKNRTRLPSALYPNAKIEDRIIADSTPPCCRECQEGMVDSGLRETAESLDMIPTQIFIVRTKRIVYHCKKCQSAPQAAALPARIAPGSSLNDSVLIQASIAKFYDLIPTDRLAKMLARAGVAIADNLLLKAQYALSEAFYPIYLKIKQEILTSRVIHADETPHRMLERDNDKAWYTWCFVSPRAVYFEIRDSRSGDVSIELLNESLATVLVSDAFSGYARTVREVNLHRLAINSPLPQLVSAFCNDHARRYFFQAQPHPLAEKALCVYEEIYTIENRVQEILLDPRYQEPEKLQKALELRQTIDLLFEILHAIACEILMENSPASLIAKAGNYYLNHLTGLTHFLQDIDVPISNAFAERSIRNPVIGRKISLGTHSEKGAKNAAVHFTVFGSCRINKVDPKEYCDYSVLLIHENKPLITPYEFSLLHKNKAPPQDPEPERKK